MMKMSDPNVLTKADILKDIEVMIFNEENMYPGRAYAVVYENKLRDAILTEYDCQFLKFIDADHSFEIHIGDILRGRASITRSMYTAPLYKHDIISRVTKQIINVDLFKDKIGKPYQINFTEDGIGCSRALNDFIGLLYDFSEEYLMFMSSYRGKVEISVSSIINSNDFYMREMV